MFKRMCVFVVLLCVSVSVGAHQDGQDCSRIESGFLVPCKLEVVTHTEREILGNRVDLRKVSEDLLKLGVEPALSLFYAAEDVGVLPVGEKKVYLSNMFVEEITSFSLVYSEEGFSVEPDRTTRFQLLVMFTFVTMFFISVASGLMAYKKMPRWCILPVSLAISVGGGLGAVLGGEGIFVSIFVSWFVGGGASVLVDKKFADADEPDGRKALRFILPITMGTIAALCATDVYVVGDILFQWLGLCAVCVVSGQAVLFLRKKGANKEAPA